MESRFQGYSADNYEETATPQNPPCNGSCTEKGMTVMEMEFKNTNWCREILPCSGDLSPLKNAAFYKLILSSQGVNSEPNL